MVVVPAACSSFADLSDQALVEIACSPIDGTPLKKEQKKLYFAALDELAERKEVPSLIRVIEDSRLERIQDQALSHVLRLGSVADLYSVLRLLRTCWRQAASSPHHIAQFARTGRTLQARGALDLSQVFSTRQQREDARGLMALDEFAHSEA